MGQHGAIRLQNEVQDGVIPVHELTEEEQWAEEHRKMHEKHKGHDAMHMEMMLIFIISVVVGQIFLVTWKRKHFKSYQMCTLIGMITIPVYVCFSRSWWRFIATWLVFIVFSAFIWIRASAQHISGGTPRMVYKWFLFLHKMSYVLGVVGYLIMMAALLGFHVLFGVTQPTLMDVGILFMFYGVYYGVLGRDFAHICTDRMASRIGYYTSEGLPKKHLEDGVCAVCGGRLDDSEHVHEAVVQNRLGEDDQEKLYKLSCGHVFHEFCIRGWVVVGKLQTCPYCKERVDLQRMFKNPWEKPHLFYGKLLDWIRYLVCWQPLIVTGVQGITTWLGLE
ncbi:CBN-RNF-121 protein [Caenorhabditis brenneri]|uniref:CBN-RNF-121 protein n=1 Tax=Caenorhabditis brenneri TaxID=135651 RepID=G0MBQ1_CAEBE|nr:CBN-RNF-121 protein [Caenorhabditis brenneri]